MNCAKAMSWFSRTDRGMSLSDGTRWGLPSTEPDLVVERKLRGHPRLQPLAAAFLDAHCLPDGEYPEGLVRSIYFETVHFDSYAEKANGDNLKTKVRLRWYGETRPDAKGEIPVFLELKLRLGASRRKWRRTFRINRDRLTSTPLDDPFFTDWLQAHCAEAALPEGFFRVPLLQIAYRRHRWVSVPDGSRISLDWDIRAERVNPTRFPWAESLVPLALPVTVCEFKHESGLSPAWVSTLCESGFRLTSFSKYGVCVERLKEGLSPL